MHMKEGECMRLWASESWSEHVCYVCACVSE